MSEGPLRGTTVVEFTNLIAGPYAGMLLADLGARVVKVEPLSGDLGRRFGPFQKGESVFFMSVNRGKESLALDTKDWVSKRALDGLVRKADVLISNLRPGALDRLGFSGERAADLNPALVYAIISAFGSEGPHADRPGVDLVFQGESGMISITGEPGDGPRKTATTIADYMAGANAALAITSALAGRERRFRRVDISLRDGLMAVQGAWNALGFANHEQPERTGTGSPYLAPNQVFQTSDRAITVAIVSDRHFELLCDAMQRPDLADGFPTNADRVAGRGSLAGKLAGVFMEKSAEHWVELLGGVGLPVGYVYNLAEAFDDPQARFHEMTVEFDHPTAGTVKTTGSAIRVDGGSSVSDVVPPRLGENTRSVLAEVGVDAHTIETMIAEGRAAAP